MILSAGVSRFTGALCESRGRPNLVGFYLQLPNTNGFLWTWLFPSCVLHLHEQLTHSKHFCLWRVGCPVPAAQTVRHVSGLHCVCLVGAEDCKSTSRRCLEGWYVCSIRVFNTTENFLFKDWNYKMVLIKWLRFKSWHTETWILATGLLTFSLAFSTQFCWPM